MHEDGGSLGHGTRDQRLAQRRLRLEPAGAGGAQFVPGHQTLGLVVAHAARVIVDDELQRRRLAAKLEQLVDLLLVFGQRESRLCLAGEVLHFVGIRVRVHRHRVALQRGGGEHAQVQPHAVVAQHEHRVALGEATLFQPCGDLQHLLEHL